MQERGGRKGISRLRVARVVGGAPHEGRLVAGPLTLRCALGRAGIRRDKREGDGATPQGRLALLYAFFRPGRFGRAGVAPTLRALRQGDVWCDDPASFSYNRFARDRGPWRCEALWRDDRLYDFIGVLDHNIRPRVAGRGSAIFLHVATPELSATAGCVALRARDLARLAPRLAPRVVIIVG
ncbi:MAG TPA: L,D-transpeptidase family protein [Methylocystis sp.]|nr:L,D-transpeptidase family protein [Methylocystis sp.]